MTSLFVSGTGTSVGKTLASALLCRRLMRLGHKVAYMKAVQTGSIMRDGQMYSADLEFVQNCCMPELKTSCPILFELPASPHLAAHQEGRTVDEQVILGKALELQASVDFLVIEGAGGLAVPLRDDYLMSDLAVDLKARLIITTGVGLGTINHTRLTCDFAQNRGLGDDMCVITSGVNKQPDIIERDNCHYISNLFDQRVLFEIPQIEKLDTEKVVTPAALKLMDEIDFNNFL